MIPATPPTHTSGSTPPDDRRRRLDLRLRRAGFAVRAARLLRFLLIFEVGSSLLPLSHPLAVLGYRHQIPADNAEGCIGRARRKKPSWRAA